jgi:hypothetical protein
MNFVLRNPLINRTLGIPTTSNPSHQSNEVQSSASQNESSQARSNDSKAADGSEETQKKARQSRALSARQFTAKVASIGLGVAWSVAETAIVGDTAKTIFSSARKRERELSNESFRRYIMTSHGEGLSKLLILSMYNGQVPKLVPLHDNSDPKIRFTLNLARSARVCSPHDVTRLAQLKKEYKGLSREAQILHAACHSNLNFARYNRLAHELVTFNEIPQDLIANLRLAGRENRLRMGEILLQMQFLDGDRDPEEIRHFNKVISKILGLDSRDDLRYFDFMESFIRERGGMAEDEASPTGYTVADKSVENPYDLSAGYTSTSAPDTPAASSVDEEKKQKE